MGIDEVDRISPITILLDEVFYQSSIQDMRTGYFKGTAPIKKWIIVSDYHLDNDKVNKVITFSLLPIASDLSQLIQVIESIVPKDIKNIQSIDYRFIELLQQLPILNISFVFRNDKYLIWNNSQEFQEHMTEYCDILTAYVAFWRTTTSNQAKLEKLQRNIRYTKELLRQKKKLKLLCEAFLISILGGYAGSLLCRETALTDLCWLSDRDSTNELGYNLIRDLFQITLIDIVKRNINFSFTTANSQSDEWYADLTRIPDIITGSISAFDLDNIDYHAAKPAVQTVLSRYLCNNRRDSFIYRFLVNDSGMKIQRILVTGI